MVTFFTTAKAFTGHTAVIQRNALRSWREAAPDAEVLLFGEDSGAAEAARELNIRHIPIGKRMPQDPKPLRVLFDEAQRTAKHGVLCYANCDIVLTRDLWHAINVVEMIRSEFLMVGRRWNIDQNEPISMVNQVWDQEFRMRARTQGKQLSGDWIDYFVFRKGLYKELPDLMIGRVFWDQWLVWKAKALGAALVDATDAVTAIHQNHDYEYHPAGRVGVWTDELSQRNYQLAGGRWHLRTIDDATHVLGPDGLRVNPLRRRRAVERSLRTAKESLRLAALQWTRPARRAIRIGGR